MFTTIMSISAKVDIDEKKGSDLKQGLLMVTADLEIDYERPTDEKLLKDYLPSLDNFSIGRILLSELVYLNKATGQGGYIEEEALTIDDRALMYVALEATALDYIQNKIDEYIP